MPYEVRLNYAPYTTQALRAFPRRHNPDPDELAARTSDLQVYGPERAIMRAWSRELPKQITADLYYYPSPTGIAPIRVALGAAGTLRNFRLAHADAPLLPSLSVLAQFWMSVWLESEVDEGDLQMCLAASSYHRGFGCADYLGRIAPWFARMGLCMDGVQHALARVAPPGTDTQYCWEILLSGVTRAVTKKNECMSRVSVRAGWEWRFRFFSELLRDPEGAQAEGDIARCICDPVTLGGAFGLHAIHKQNSYTTEVRTEALASDAVRIIDVALNNLPYPSERAAEQAISAFLTISL
ncbi:hypothetical protein EV121DRAFT_291155 [Schizophyllum commune]